MNQSVKLLLFGAALILMFTGSTILSKKIDKNWIGAVVALMIMWGGFIFGVITVS